MTIIIRCVGAEFRAHVDGWPGQENTPWDQRVPSVVLYDSSGQVSTVQFIVARVINTLMTTAVGVWRESCV